MKHLWRVLLLVFLAGPIQGVQAHADDSNAGQQSPAQPRDAETAEQTADQKALAAYIAERTRLSSMAKQALRAEAEREKAGDCPDAQSTRHSEVCLEKEGKTTQGNFEALVDSLRAELALTPPDVGQGPAAVGPTGRPLTPSQQAAHLDATEQEWEAYRKQAVSLAYDQFKGGTEAPVFAAEASQALLRSHMRELGFLYDFMLGNH